MHQQGQARLRILVAALATGALVLLVAGPGTAQQDESATPVVEAARQVSTLPDPARALPSPQLAVHPDDPDTVVAVAADARGGGCHLFASRDAGLSWFRTADLLPDRFDFCSQRNYGRYANAEFGPDGSTLYAGFSVSSEDAGHPNGPITALVARTSNLGRTHETSTVIEAGEEQVTTSSEDGGEETLTLPQQFQYNSLAVAPDDPQTVYTGFKSRLAPPSTFAFGAVPPDRSDLSMVAVSEDGGESWGEPVNLTDDAELAGDFEGERPVGTDIPQLVAGEGGTVYAFTKERPADAPEGEPEPTSRLFMFRSTDGGASWTLHLVHEGAKSLDTIGDAAMDPDTGRLYVVWAERGESRELALTPYLATSDDGGRTWSEPVQLVGDDVAESYNQYFPAIDVAPDGRVDIAWHDFRNDPFYEVDEDAGSASQRFADVYYTWSTDGGSTFAEPVRVTDRSIDRSIGITVGSNFFIAPPGLASTEDSAYLAWADTRAGTPTTSAEDVYFTRVRLGARAEPAAAGRSDGGPTLLGVLIGAGGALLLAGLVVGGFVRSRRPRGAGA